jgi:BlaI family penicillinase repressor
MPKIPKVTESEWKVMKVVWSMDNPVASYDIIQKLSTTEDWKPETIKTLLNRLVKKGVLGYN